MGISVEFDEAAIAKFLAEDAAVWAELAAAGDMAVKAWKSASPVGTVTHTLKSGFVVNPEDYRNSIRWRMMHGHGERFCRVQAHDFKADWIEYGSIHNPDVVAPCAKTRSYMLAQPGFSAG